MNRRTTIGLIFGGRQMLILALLVAFILGGNGLLIWQFRIARQETDRLAVMSRKVTVIQRLQYSLASFHQTFYRPELRDPRALSRQFELLQKDLLEQIRKTREVISVSPSDRRREASLLVVLDAMEIGFPHQLQSINAVAETGDWAAVANRVALRLEPSEIEITAHAKDIDDAFTAELARSGQNAVQLQNRILVLIPFMALSTFLLAALFVWFNAQRIIELQLEERLSERMRIARDLHDTLLQDFQAMILRFDSVSRRLVRGDPNRVAMDEGLSYADEVLREGRNRIRDIRANTMAPQDLSRAFAAYANELSQLRAVAFDVKVTGAQTEIDPIVRDHIYRIGREAIGNAFKHSDGSTIEIALAFSPRELQMTIRDNGKGIESSILNAGGKPGHWGMYNMRERARKIGASLEFSSVPTVGTILELKLPLRSLKRSFASWFPWRSKPASKAKRIDASAEQARTKTQRG